MMAPAQLLDAQAGLLPLRRPSSSSAGQRRSPGAGSRPSRSSLAPSPLPFRRRAVAGPASRCSESGPLVHRPSVPTLQFPRGSDNATPALPLASRPSTAPHTRPMGRCHAGSSSSPRSFLLSDLSSALAHRPSTSSLATSSRQVFRGRDPKGPSSSQPNSTRDSEDPLRLQQGSRDPSTSSRQGSRDPSTSSRQGSSDPSTSRQGSALASAAGADAGAAMDLAGPGAGGILEQEQVKKEKRGKSSSGGGSVMPKIGVLLLNLGGPETLDDVQPFLYNLFADPDIIRLPRPLRFLQRPLAQFISTLRAPKSQEGYAAIGGGSPLRKITMEQADALKQALVSKGQESEVYVGMRYWHPFTEEAIEEIKKDGIQRLVVLPLYPQFSITTSGSSLRLLEAIFRRDPYLVTMEHTVIPSWYQRRGYVEAMADLIQQELQKGAFPRPEEANIFFSAHGVPVAYVEEAGDPYKAEMEECIALIMDELRRRGVPNEYTLAYQSRVGPVEWLKPYTDDTIRELGKGGCKSLLAVPISFVSEHIETLEEIDCEYKELALESGVQHWGRVPALNCEPRFIQDLADAVIEALPYVGAMATSSLEARQALVPLGSVEELLATYDIERRELPAPVSLWEWGWTRSAETWNGRVAMLAVLVLLVWEVSTGQGVLHQFGVLR